MYLIISKKISGDFTIEYQAFETHIQAVSLNYVVADEVDVVENISINKGILINENMEVGENVVVVKEIIPSP